MNVPAPQVRFRQKNPNILNSNFWWILNFLNKRLIRFYVHELLHSYPFMLLCFRLKKFRNRLSPYNSISSHTADCWRHFPGLLAPSERPKALIRPKNMSYIFFLRHNQKSDSIPSQGTKAPPPDGAFCQRPPSAPPNVDKLLIYFSLFP